MAVAHLALISLLLVPLSCNGEYYSFDGSGNNLNHTNWGVAGTPFVKYQILPEIYEITTDSKNLPNPRQISTSLNSIGEKGRLINGRGMTSMLTYIGQFIAHDLQLTRHKEIQAPIPIPTCDSKFDIRCTGTRELDYDETEFFIYPNNSKSEINDATAFLDGSMIYGTTLERSIKLRAGVKGKMAAPGGFLPENILNFAMDHKKYNSDILKAAGDPRANVVPQILALNSLFIREHNRLADFLAVQNPSWSDEQLYQEARKWNIAYLQSVCFNEYLPALGVILDTYSGYKPEVNPGIDSFFGTVTYRYGHSEITNIIYSIDDNGMESTDGHMLMSEMFFSPDKALSNGIEPILRGMSMEFQEEVDIHFASSVKNYFCGTPGLGATDLIASDIQRSRDHGIPKYNREMGLLQFNSFSEMTSDIYIQRVLESLYASIDDVDAFIGCLLEEHLRGSNLGPLLHKSMKEQFTRIRDGDRLFYANSENGMFTEDEITSIRSTRLRDIILRNTEIKQLPLNIFTIDNFDKRWPDPVNPSNDATEQDNASFTQTQEKQLLEAYKLSYWVEGDNVHFIICAKTTGFVAIGLEGSEGGMINADIMVAYVQNGKAEVIDCWSTAYAEPIPDVNNGGTNDITLHEFTEEDGYTEVHFSRPLDTGDIKDRPIAIGNDTKIIFSYHDDSDSLTYHGFTNRGKSTIRLSEATSAISPSSTEDKPVLGGQLSLLDGIYKLSWTVLSVAEDYDHVAFEVSVKGEGWIGFGLPGTSYDMVGADMVVMRITDNGECEAEDYWSETFVEPIKDTKLGGTNDVSNVTCYRKDGLTKFNFTKPTKSTDKNDRIFNVKNPTPIIFSYYGSSDTLQYHGAGNRGSAEAVTTELKKASGSSVSFDNMVFSEAQLGEITLLWATVGDELTIRMRANKDIWMGIGLEPGDGGMTNTDIYIGHKKDGQMIVMDCWSTGYYQPTPDSEQGGKDSLIASGASVVDGVYEYWFTRKYDTGDVKDSSIKNAEVNFIYAYGTSSTLEYHGANQRFKGAINFASSSGVKEIFDTGALMMKVHGYIMVSAWALVSMIGTGFARFGRGWQYWLTAHRIIQITTIVVALIGEIIGFSFTKGSFRTSHSITAICVVFVTFPQVSLGVAAMKQSSNSNFNKLHKGTGYFLIGLALWQAWTGMITLDVSEALKLIYLAWVVALLTSFHFSNVSGTIKELEGLLKVSQASLISGDKHSVILSKKSVKSNNGGDIEKNEDNTAIAILPPKKTSIIKSRKKVSQAAKELIDLLRLQQASDGDSEESVSKSTWSKIDGGFELENDTITTKEFYKANKKGSKWTIINNIIYDIGAYIADHPGGEKAISSIIGINGTSTFLEVHGDDNEVIKVLKKLIVAELQDDIDTDTNESIDSDDENEKQEPNTTNTPPLLPQEIKSEDNKIQIDIEQSKNIYLQPLSVQNNKAEDTKGINQHQFKKFKIETITKLSDDVVTLRIDISGDEVVWLPVTSHIMIRGVDQDTGKNVVRCFTPLIPDQTEFKGKMDILIKCYEDGKMSKYIRTLVAEKEIEIKGPIRGLDYVPGTYANLGLVGGGSGITPLWQVLECVLKNKGDESHVTLIYQNRFEKDILLRETLDGLAKEHPIKFKLVYILSKPPKGWSSFSGRVDADFLKQHLPPPDPLETFVMVCGPPAMNKSLGGELDIETNIKSTGILHEMGYSEKNIHMF